MSGVLHPGTDTDTGIAAKHQKYFEKHSAERSLFSAPRTFAMVEKLLGKNGDVEDCPVFALSVFLHAKHTHKAKKKN